MTDPLFLHIAVLRTERMREAQRWRARRRGRPDAAAEATPPESTLLPHRRPVRAAQ